MTEPTPDLAAAERRWREVAERRPGRPLPLIAGLTVHDLPALLSEYDRRGEVERLADSVVTAEQRAARELEAENATLRMQLADLMAAVERARHKGVL